MALLAIGARSIRANARPPPQKPVHPESGYAKTPPPCRSFGRSNQPNGLGARLIAEMIDRRRLQLRWSQSHPHLAQSPSAPAGKTQRKVAPRLALGCAQSRPPWASTIDRLIRSPIPIPCDFVVYNGS